MDDLIDLGSRCVCAAAHAVATPSLEVQMCGSGVSRTTVGIVAILVAALLIAVVLTQIAAGRATRA